MTMSKAVGKRHRLTRAESRAVTRERLLTSGEEVFAERGFYGAAIEEIAERAGLSSGAFYSNFESKEELLLAVMHKRSEETISEIRQILDSNHAPADFFRAMRERRARRASDPAWYMLQLEFALFCMRNPEARAKLAERERHLRELFAHTVAAQHEIMGVPLPAPAEQLGLMIRALDQGFDLQKYVDPEGVPQEAFVNALEFLSRAFVALSLHPDSVPDVTPPAS